MINIVWFFPPPTIIPSIILWTEHFNLCFQILGTDSLENENENGFLVPLEMKKIIF